MVRRGGTLYARKFINGHHMVVDNLKTREIRYKCVRIYKEQAGRLGYSNLKSCVFNRKHDECNVYSVYESG